MENNLKLDYSIQSPQERTALVRKIIQSLPPERLTHTYLEILANYIIYAKTKEEKKKEKSILTQNRMITLNRRETSFQGLVAKFENGEDGIYNIIANDKNIIFTPKVSITAEDLENIPPLKQLHDAILKIQQEQKAATGKRRYLLRKQLIQMRKDQYQIKNSYQKTIYCLNGIKSFNTLVINNNITIQSDGTITDRSLISFMNPKHISALLCNYSRLKEECYGKFYTDGFYLIQDLQQLVDAALKVRHPLYYALLIYKIDGKQNIEIQQLLYNQFKIRHSIEYISALWRNKIPKLIAEQAQKQYLEWYYMNCARGQWKKCSRCGQIKLAHNKFFSKNNSSKDGFYSICKQCRNAKIKKVSSYPKIIKRIPYQRSKEDNEF